MLARAFGTGGVVASRGYSYKLGSTLYLALTDRCNTATTLLSRRGPGFSMPATSGFRPLGDNPEPSPEDLARIVDEHYSSNVDIVGMGENDAGVTFAGLGEPTLRLDALLDTGACFRWTKKILRPAQRFLQKGLTVMFCFAGGCVVSTHLGCVRRRRRWQSSWCTRRATGCPSAWPPTACAARTWPRRSPLGAWVKPPWPS